MAQEDIIKLYNLPRDENIKIYGFKDTKGKDTVIIFGHLDGAYSYCWLEGQPKKLVHLSATLQLKKYKDGYKVYGN